VDLGAPDDPVYCLLPKLHRERCVIIPPNRVHVGSKIRKRAPRYMISVDSSFDRVLQGCIEQHGERSWLYRPLRNALIDLHRSGRKVVHSIELWDAESGQLVAGEIGYHVGSIYTSMTGFYNRDGCGTIQLIALAFLLAKTGITVWDLGMSMDYKLEMGAECISRHDWLRLVRQYRNQNVDWDRIRNLGRLNVKEQLG
jgi:Leu/Phe-tRNA-protein transferase